MMTMRLSSRVAASIARTDASRPISSGPTCPGSWTSVRSGMTGYWPAVSVCLVIESSRVYDVSFVSAVLAQALNELHEEFFRVVIQLARDVDLHGHEVIACTSGAAHDTLSAQAEPFAARRAGRCLDVCLAV